MVVLTIFCSVQYFPGPAHQAQKKMKMKQLAEVETEYQELLAASGHLFDSDNNVQIRLPVPSGSFSLNQKLLEVDDVSFGYGGDVQTQESVFTTAEKHDPATLLFKHVEFSVYSDSRIVFLGKNGSGKTTLLNLLHQQDGSVVPSAGSVKLYPGVKVTMLQQHHYKGEQLDPNLNSNEHIRLLQIQHSNNPTMMEQINTIRDDQKQMSDILQIMTRQEEAQIRNYLSNFGINNSTPVIPVRYLSGGQKMKLALAVALYEKPDILILDEVIDRVLLVFCLITLLLYIVFMYLFLPALLHSLLTILIARQ